MDGKKLSKILTYWLVITYGIFFLGFILSSIFGTPQDLVFTIPAIIIIIIPVILSLISYWGLRKGTITTREKILTKLLMIWLVIITSLMGLTLFILISLNPQLFIQIISILVVIIGCFAIPMGISIRLYNKIKRVLEN